MRKLFLMAACLIGMIVLSKAQNSNILAFSKSYEHELRDDYPNALRSMEQIYEANSYEINLRVGWLHYMNEDYIKSQKYYKIAMQLRPESLEAMFGYAYPVYAMENTNELIGTYKKVLEIDPKNYTANYYLAFLFYERKDFNNALPHAISNAKHSPFDFTSNLILGQIYLGLGKIDEAKEFLHLALLYSPESKEPTKLLENL